MDFEKIIHALIDDIVDEPESVFIRSIESENGKDLTILIAAEKDDIARLIGRHGTIANSLREVISIAGKSENKHIHVKFESFGEDADTQENKED